MTPETNSPPCVCCWPRFVPATVMDLHGWPCCNECMQNADRRPNLPSFALRHLVRGVDLAGHPDMVEGPVISEANPHANLWEAVRRSVLTSTAIDCPLLKGRDAA